MIKKKNIVLLIFFLQLTIVRSQQPNIVWITSEDNSKHYMSLFDANGVSTPNIETLANHGIIFNNAFSNAAVCSAARSTLITSSYGPRLASHYHRTDKKITIPNSLEMFPAYLKRAGYYTANNSKEDYNLIKAEHVWDESSKKASWKNKKEGQPFFYVHNIHVTHESSMHFPEEAINSGNIITNLDDVFVQPNHPQTKTFKYTNALYRDKIRVMDDEVDKVLSELKKEGLLENTFIFYFGDHGGVLPNSKGYLKEMGLHVPLVVYIPPKFKHLSDFDIGTKTKGFVSFVDFGATVLNIADIEIPKTMDGKPFLGKRIKASDIEKQDEVFGYADRFDEKYDMVRSLRKGKYKYIRNFQPFNVDGLMNNYRYKQLAYKEWKHLYEEGKLNEIQSKFFEPKQPEELYDIEQDPYEVFNLVEKPEFAKVLKTMRLKLNKKMNSMPDLSFYPEHILIEKAFNNPLKFGKEHKKQISDYIAIADLQLIDKKKGDKKIILALQSTDPWKRYWALNVCSSFGKELTNLSDLIIKIMKSDSELINKVKAAEFLGITGLLDPTNPMTDALYKSKNEKEALLILNSMVLMQDFYNIYTFNIQLEKVKGRVKENKLVKERLKYLKVL